MAVSVANTAGGNYTNSTSTHSVNWSGSFTPSAGNSLLLVLHVGGNSSEPATPPNGWVQVGSRARATYTTPFGHVAYLKLNCSAADTSVTINGWGTGGLNGRWSCTEFEGAALSGALGPTADNGLAGSSPDTSISSGTTATLAQATGLALAIMVMDNGNNMTGAYSPGSWSMITSQNRTSNGGHEVYSQPLTSTAGISVTYSGYTSDESYICVAALYDAAPTPTVTLSNLEGYDITSSGFKLRLDYDFA